MAAEGGGVFRLRHVPRGDTGGFEDGQAWAKLRVKTAVPATAWRAGAQGSRGVQHGGRRSQAAAGEDGRAGRGSGWT